ncbi:putative cytochrome P450 [Hypoxylon sp. FL0543]|nr:putative cytochrome P450 [Hypoxylon sp. FL0543]
MSHDFSIILLKTRITVMLSFSVWECAGGVLVAYLIGLVVYRLYFHPLSEFPGPKLAAATVWYEFYYDGIKGGRYTFKIREMHEQYGPIIRISPNELHCNDLGFIDTLYAGGSARRDKYAYYATQFGISESAFGTVNHNLHRLRRGAINRFFSRASVSKLEPVIYDKVELLCRQLRTHLRDENPVQLNMAFSCFTTDVVAAYAFAKSYDFLADASFELNFHEPMMSGIRLGSYFKQFPFLIPLMDSLPNSWVAALNPAMGRYLAWQHGFETQIREIKDRKDAGKPIAEDYNSHISIFDELLESNLPDREKSTTRLWQECQAIIGAGTETVAWTLSVIFFYVLNNHNVYENLMMELEGAIPDPVSRLSWSDLEKLPYLNACISEGLRLSYGIASRLQRISPDGPLLYRPSDGVDASRSEYVIPRGTPVGMTSVLVHHNPKFFPRSSEFDPKRWLDAQGGIDRTLEKYLISFSRGSRQCVGINLAHAELFMVTGLLFRRLGRHLRLYETGLDDVEVLHDFFMPTPKLDSKGIRVLLV